MSGFVQNFRNYDPTLNELAFYTAHLHIDILEQYQRKGIGSCLIKRFEHHLISREIKGVCLGTSE
ncbi:MAG: hypothetical protein ACOC4M_09855 [Promethearchaeia archaeon]